MEAKEIFNIINQKVDELVINNTKKGEVINPAAEKEFKKKIDEIMRLGWTYWKKLLFEEKELESEISRYKAKEKSEKTKDIVRAKLIDHILTYKAKELEFYRSEELNTSFMRWVWNKKMWKKYKQRPNNPIDDDGPFNNTLDYPDPHVEDEEILMRLSLGLPENIEIATLNEKDVDRMIDNFIVDYKNHYEITNYLIYLRKSELSYIDRYVFFLAFVIGFDATKIKSFFNDPDIDEQLIEVIIEIQRESWNAYNDKHQSS